MADMTPQGTQAYSVESGYESADANVKSIVSGLLIILASTLVVMAAMLGMFKALNGSLEAQDARVPAARSVRVIPPEPRLLPEIYSDELHEAKRLEAEGKNGKSSTPDGLPWDKRNLEIVTQYDESNAYANYTGENGRPAIRIPMSRAVELTSGAAKGGTPAGMTWQPEYPRLIAGEKDGTMNLVAGAKNEEKTTFDERVFWETQDEKFNNESSGGQLLKSDQLSR